MLSVIRQGQSWLKHTNSQFASALQGSPSSSQLQSLLKEYEAIEKLLSQTLYHPSSEFQETAKTVDDATFDKLLNQIEIETKNNDMDKNDNDIWFELSNSSNSQLNVSYDQLPIKTKEFLNKPVCPNKILFTVFCSFFFLECFHFCPFDK